MREVEREICSRCIMNTTVLDIKFYKDGCSVCIAFENKVKKHVLSGDMALHKWNLTIQEARKNGVGKRYDCVLGISGGLDSSYLAYLLWTEGLRVLLLHIDSGWNSELSEENLNKIVEKTGFDLMTVTLPAEEFTDITKAYMKADVIDIEAPFDHIIPYYLYNVTDRLGIKYAFTASNTLTEGLMPQSWRFDKADAANIRDIHKKHGTIPRKDFPLLNPWKTFVWYRLLKRIKILAPLNWWPYERAKALETVQKAFDWQDYGGKNYESLFTMFDKAYIQVSKFNIDKRRALMSNLIMTGEITREEGLVEMGKPPIPWSEVKKLKETFLEKMGMTEAEFNSYLVRPVKSHYDYKHGVWIHRAIGLLRWIKYRGKTK